jgi:hypothetical protein
VWRHDSRVRAGVHTLQVYVHIGGHLLFEVVFTRRKCMCTQVGIFYDKEVQAEAAALVSDWTLADMEYMREQVGRLQGPGCRVQLITTLRICCFQRHKHLSQPASIAALPAAASAQVLQEGQRLAAVELCLLPACGRYRRRRLHLADSRCTRWLCMLKVQEWHVKYSELTPVPCDAWKPMLSILLCRCHGWR